MGNGRSRERITAACRHVQNLLESVSGRPGRAEGLLTEALAGLQRAVDALQEAEADLGDGIERPASRPAVMGRGATTVSESPDWPAAILDSAPLVVVLVDHDLQVVRANRAAVTLADQSAEQMHGCRAGNALRCLNALADPRGCGFGPSCGKCKVRQTVLDTHTTGEARRQVQARLPLRRDGNEALVDLLISTVPLEYPGRRMVLVWLEDVTRVVQNEASLRTFLEAMPESAFVMSSDGTVIEANTEVASRLGILRDDLLGANIYQYVSEDVRDVRRRQVESVLQSGEPARFKDWRKGRHIDNIIAPVLDPGGEMKCLAILGLDITDQEQTKAGLRESEEKFRSFVENANDIIYTLAPDGTFTYTSSNVSAQLGFEPYELLGRHYTDLVHPEDTPACDAFFQQVITTGKSAGGVTYRLRCKNGRWLWHTSNASGLTDGEGNVVSYLGISRDITEQKRQEALLLESEARYRQLVELAQEGIWALDASGRTTFANPRMAQMLGYTVAEMERRAFYEFMDESQVAAAEAYFRNRQEGQSEHHEFRFRRRDGSALYANLAAAPLQDAEGSFAGAFAVVSDITERKLAELELRLTLDATTDGIWTWNFATDELTFSPRYYTMLGYEPGAFPASFESWRDLIHPDDRNAALAVATEYLRTKPDVYENQFRLRNKKGEYRWIQTVGKVVERGSDGQAIRMIGNHSDITGRKTTEEEVKLFRAIVDSSELAVAVSDSEGRLQYINPAHERLFGHTLQEAQRLNYRTYYPAESVDVLDRVVAPALERGEEWEGVLDAIDATGRRFSLWEHAGVVHDEQGKLRCAYGFMRDDTERLQAQQQLEISEQRFRSFVQASSAGMWATDSQGNNTYVSPQWSAITGVPASDAKGHGWSKGLHPDDRERVQQGWMEAARADRPYLSEFRFLHPDGRVVWVLCQASSVKNAHGETVEWIGTITDVSDQKRVEHELRESEARFRTLVESAPVSILAMRDRKYVFGNPASARLLGFNSPADFTGMDALACIAPEFHSELLDRMRRVEQGEANEPIELQMIRPDGSRVWSLSTSVSIQIDGQQTALIVGQDITQAKRAEEMIRESERTLRSTVGALRESEERLRLANRATNDVIWDWDIIHDSQMWNPAGATVFGWSDITRHPQTAAWWTERVHPDDQQRVADGFSAAVHDPSQTQWQDEYRFRKSDGSYATVLDRGYVMRDEQGRAVRMIGAMLDITDRKRAEEQLREALLWQETAIAAGHVGFWDWDLQTNTVVYSREWKSQIGYEEHEIGNGFEEWQTRLHPDDREATLRLVRESIAEARPSWEVQFRFRHKDGSYRWILAQASVLCDDTGRAIRTLGAHVDITERKRAEETLHESEIRYRTIADYTYDWETWIGPDGRLLYCSPSVKRITGYSSEELLNDQALIKRMVHPDDRAVAEDHLDLEMSESSSVLPLDYRIHTKNGEERWVSHYCMPVYDDHGQCAGRRGSTRDITDRKRLEEQLRHSQKLQAVGELAGGVAHDFNNLLTAVFGHCELLEKAVGESVEVNSALEGIREAARQAAGVTRSLLTFSAKLPSYKQRVELQELVRKTVHVMGRMLPASIDVVREPAEAAPIWLHADGVHLQQIIMNLAINARDAMPDGGTLHITVDELSGDVAKTVRLEQADENAPQPARFARLIVSDTGTGMPPDILSRVFEPFFTTKERGRGTGLGLAIVHGIVKEHNGHIEVDSAPGEGTTFTITLPVLDSEPQDAVKERVANEARSEGELVLLAEDDWNIRSLVATVLKDAGFEVCEATDGESLMARFAELADRASLLVLDVNLPRRSGLDCLREIRAVAADTPAIVITGGAALMNADELDRYTVLLRKPFSMGELKQQAAKLVCGHSRKEAGT